MKGCHVTPEDWKAAHDWCRKRLLAGDMNPTNGPEHTPVAHALRREGFKNAKVEIFHPKSHMSRKSLSRGVTWYVAKWEDGDSNRISPTRHGRGLDRGSLRGSVVV